MVTAGDGGWGAQQQAPAHGPGAGGLPASGGPVLCPLCAQGPKTGRFLVYSMKGKIFKQ